jgi:hypothetical protein
MRLIPDAGCTAPALRRGTLVDGELLDSGCVGFDAVALGGIPVWGLPHAQRMRATAAAMAALRLPGIPVSTKAWLPVGPGMAQLPAAEGLVFVSLTAPMLPGGAGGAGLLKWKRSHTLDFYVAADGAALLVCDPTGKHVPAPPDIRQPAVPWAPQWTNGVVECSVAAAAVQQPDRGDEAWVAVPIRRRPDKSSPNQRHVVEATLRQIREAVTLAELRAL